MAKHHKILILIIGAALFIGLMSEPDNQYESKTPWNIQTLDDGRIYVFGLTPGKTTIQEANQILGHFAETRLLNTDPPRLLATHEDLLLGSEPARIDLSYAIDEVELADIQQSSALFSPCQSTTLTMEQEIALLNTSIATIIYTPKTDYSVKSVRRHLGDADEVQQINDNEQVLLYRKLNLTVYINDKKPDVFIYADRVQAAATPVSGDHRQ